MLTKRADDIRSSEITPEHLYINRRQFMAASGFIAGAALGGFAVPGSIHAGVQAPLPKKGPYDTDEAQTPYNDVTTYNNFYEFGLDKDQPARNARTLKPKPWTVAIEGHVEKPGSMPLEELIKGITVEDRIYRMRCVEGWSMVIPWQGVPLAEVVKRLKPTAKAKYVEFQTLYAPDQMPGQKSNVLDWPYVEGLRLDEAMNPLSLLAIGLYGKQPLPNQNGAPIRLVTPWKYGFKGVKSIAKIRLVEKQPETAWVKANAHEYGFYANVNPEVDHPRWSQARERRLGEFFRRKTLMFNGYGDQVASMYTGLDLRKNY